MHSCSKLQRWAAGAALAGALALCGSVAQAVVYNSVFDPPDFRGTATFDVSQGCLDVGTGYAFPGGSCTVEWLTAEVTFTSGPTFTFDYADLLPDSGIVNFIRVEEGDLAGVNSNELGPHSVSGAPDSSYDGLWWTQYSFPPPDIISVLDGPPSTGTFGLGVVYLYSGACTPSDLPDVPPICTPAIQPSEVAQVEFFRATTVPEPGTVLLVALAGLLGAGLSRRRKPLEV